MDTNFSYHSTKKVSNREVVWMALAVCTALGKHICLTRVLAPGWSHFSRRAGVTGICHHSWHFSPLDTIPPHPDPWCKSCPEDTEEKALCLRPFFCVNKASLEGCIGSEPTEITFSKCKITMVESRSVLTISSLRLGCSHGGVLFQWWDSFVGTDLYLWLKFHRITLSTLSHSRCVWGTLVKSE